MHAEDVHIVSRSVNLKQQDNPSGHLFSYVCSTTEMYMDYTTDWIHMYLNRMETLLYISPANFRRIQ
jgi:hypothetical protein